MALAADEGISKTNTVSRVWKEELYNVDNVWEPYEGLDFNLLFGKVSFKTLLTLLFKHGRKYLVLQVTSIAYSNIPLLFSVSLYSFCSFVKNWLEYREPPYLKHLGSY